MGFLEQIGLSPKKSPELNIGKNRKKEQDRTGEKRLVIWRTVILVAYIFLMIFLMLGNRLPQGISYNVGEPWLSEDLNAPFTFPILKTEQEIQNERDEVIRNTPPIFKEDPSVQLAVNSKFDAIGRVVQANLRSYQQWNNNLSATSDSLQFLQQIRSNNLGLPEETWLQIGLIYSSVEFEASTDASSASGVGTDTGSISGTGTTSSAGGINSTSRSGPIQQKPVQFTNDLRSALSVITSHILSNGLIDRPAADIETSTLSVRNITLKTERVINRVQVYDLSSANRYARLQLLNQFEQEVGALGLAMLERAIEPNWLYDEQETRQRIDQNLETLSETKGAIAAGQVIIRKGDLVTEETRNILRSLNEKRAETATNIERFVRLSGNTILMIIAVLVFFLYLRLYRKSIMRDLSHFSLIFVTMMLISVVSSIVFQFESLNDYVIPIAIAPVMLTIIFDSRVGLMSALTLAIVTGLMSDNSYEFMVATVLASSLGIFTVRDLQKRSQFFFITPGIIFITYLLVISGFAMTRYSEPSVYLTNMAFAGLNALFILFTYPIILLFEKIFKVTTDFTLMELSDSNSPLLKDLIMKAPGSYHHSLNVSTIAENAAVAIGANFMLTRTGALYHDIGKMTKPEYFIENQTGGNEHDTLAPQMSALVIKKHVTEGVRLAKEAKLPKTIVDFIETHHGTSLIRYFYKRAKNHPVKKSDITEEDFRYEGPLPFSKEQGIVMLADGVEAASRSIQQPSYQKLENLVHKIIDEHVKDGQLNNCPLTFRELSLIKASFTQTLRGIYHGRVDYDKDDEYNKDAEIKSGETYKSGVTDNKDNDDSDNTKATGNEVTHKESASE